MGKRNAQSAIEEIQNDALHQSSEDANNNATVCADQAVVGSSKSLIKSIKSGRLKKLSHKMEQTHEINKRQSASPPRRHEDLNEPDGVILDIDENEDNYGNSLVEDSESMNSECESESEGSSYASVSSHGSSYHNNQTQKQTAQRRAT